MHPSSFEPHQCLDGRRILLLGSARQVLAACRDLGEAGATVDVARRAGERDLVSSSRWIREHHVIPDPQEDIERFAAAIRDIASSGGHDIVFPGGDEYLAPLSAARDDLPASVPLAPHASILAVLDKIAIESAVAEAGLRTPRTTLATDEVVMAWEGPAIIKDRSHWNPGTEASHRPAVYAADPAAVVVAVETIRAEGGHPVVQEVLDGRMLCFSAFRSPAGTVSGRVQQTSDHLWPVPLGTTSRTTSTPIDATLADSVARLLDGLEWVGPVNLQLFHDGATYTLIDFNGRFNHSLALALAAGVHTPSAWAHATLTGDDVVLADARPGVRLSLLAPDLKRALTERRGGLLRDVAGTLAFAGIAHHGIPDVRDPGPALAYLTKDRFGRRPQRMSPGAYDAASG